MQSTTTSTRTFMTPPAATEQKTPKKPRQKRNLKFRLNLSRIIIILLVLFSIFMYTQYRDVKDKLSDSSTARQDSSVIANVRKLVVVPISETPTVATVVNASKLQSQTFFANARDGDKVLVFNREKEAILYRPATNQIVTIAPVTVSPSVNNLAGQ